MADTLPRVAGKLTPAAPLAPLVWFKSGGVADTLFEPADVEDLQAVLRDLDPATSVWPLGLGSNLIVRDGGVRGVTLRPVATNAATASHIARAATGSAAPWRRWASSE